MTGFPHSLKVKPARTAKKLHKTAKHDMAVFAQLVLLKKAMT